MPEEEKETLEEETVETETKAEEESVEAEPKEDEKILPYLVELNAKLDTLAAAIRTLSQKDLPEASTSEASAPAMLYL